VGDIDPILLINSYIENG